MTTELPLIEGVVEDAGRHVTTSPAPRPLAVRPSLAWLIDDVLLTCYRALIPKLNVWRWADAGNVFLDEKATALPGAYDSSKTPLTREFQETFSSPDWDEDHVMKSSRVGITEAALNVVRYMPHHTPGAALIAIDTTDEAKKIATDRLIPTLPAAALTDDADDVTKKLIRLRNMLIHIAGSYSPTIFRNKWLRLAFLDEIEVVEEIDDEGTLHDLARSRMHDVPGAKLLTASKPKRHRSKHHCEVATGTLSAAFVPCLHCGTFQELGFDGQSPTYQLRIEDGQRSGQPPLTPPLGHIDPATGMHTSVPAPRVGRFRFEHCKDMFGHWDLGRIEQETWYECVAGCRIEEHATVPASSRWIFKPLAALDGLPTTPAHLRAPAHGAAVVLRRLDEGRTVTTKWAMLQAGVWLATNHRHVPRKRSRHLWDAHSLHEKLTWGFLAREFVIAQADPAKLMHWLNNHAGLPWRQRRAAVGDEHIAHCLRPYRRGTTPFEPVIILIGVDSQFDHYKAVTAAYRLNRERAVVNWGRFAAGADILAEMSRPVPLSTDESRTFPVHSGFVDAAGAEGTTDRVYELCRRSRDPVRGHQRLWPSFGRDYEMSTKVVWSSEVPHEFRPVTIYFFADEIFKQRLYHGTLLRAAEINAAIATGHEPELKGLPPRLQIPGVPSDHALREFRDELMSEHINEKGKWAKTPGVPNDYGDALKLCDVLFDWLRPKLVEAAAAAERTAKAKSAPPTV
jgi:hypothetical protein